MHPAQAVDHPADPSISDLNDATGSGELAALTAFDRCDSAGCSAQAYLRARLAGGLELVFCAHHGHELVPALVGRGAVLRDDSHTLVENRLLGG